MIEFETKVETAVDAVLGVTEFSNTKISTHFQRVIYSPRGFNGGFHGFAILHLRRTKRDQSVRLTIAGLDDGVWAGEMKMRSADFEALRNRIDSPGIFREFGFKEFEVFIKCFDGTAYSY